MVLRRSFGFKMLALTLIVASLLAIRAGWFLVGPETDRSAEAQGQTGTCPNAQFIDEFTGTGSQTSDTFQTTTDSFRISYDLVDTDTQDGIEPSLILTVNGEEGAFLEDASQDGAGSGETFVNQPPGTYSLDITALGGAQYTITVEQCEGGGASTSPDDQYDDQTSDDVQYEETTITEDQYDDRPLMNAGGPEDGPVPAMPGGQCPEEFPKAEGGACYR